MRNIILITTLIFSNITFSQINDCDQKILSKKEYEKCVKDSIWTNDLKIKIEYITSLKSSLLPKYRQLRKQIETSNDVDLKVSKIKTLYDSVFVMKTNQYKNDLDKKNDFVQPKSYLSSVLSFELFKFYPDIYAILLNPIHQQLNPKTNIKDLNEFKRLIDELVNNIPQKEYIEITQIVKKLRVEKQYLLNNKQLELFQGTINDEERLKYDVANFLIWKE